MTRGPDPLARRLARAARPWAQAQIRRGALIGLAGLLGAAGAGFIVFAGYAALRPALGPALAALVTGAVLAGVAMALAALSIRGPAAVEQEAPDAPPAPPMPSSDLATLAIFTLAFVFGRRLAERSQD